MDEWLARILTVTYPTVIACGTALAIYWLKLRSDRRLQERRGADIEQLADELDRLRGEQAAAIAELQERLDFTERVLTQERLGRIEEPRTPTPV